MPRWNLQWKVDSSSSPGKTYTVSEAFDGTWACSCPAWTRMRKECKHIKLVKMRLATGITDKAIVLITENGHPAAPDVIGAAINEAIMNREAEKVEEPPRQLSLLERLAIEAPWRMKR
jgi:uncharacterized Zn finger protein